MAKEVKTTVTNEVITGAPAPNTVRIYPTNEDGQIQDVYPVDAKEAVATGNYSLEPNALAPHSEGVYKPVRPETLAAVLPEAKEPLEDIQNRVEEEDGAKLRGTLPEDFPHRAALDAAGYGTYAKARKLVAKGEGWYKDVPNIGDKTYGDVEKALKEK